MLDLNGLKTVNDDLGHAAGDILLRRAGEVLGKSVDKPQYAARVGGDEFVLLLPDTDASGAHALSQRLLELIELNNQFHQSPRLSFAMGIATCMPGERLEAALNRADQQMYASKRAYYEQSDIDRRHDEAAERAALPHCVEPRAMQRPLSNSFLAGSSGFFNRSDSSSMALRPMSSTGCSNAVRPGSTISVQLSLSNPATAMSRAICNPAWRTARTSPMSNRPLLAISASGRSYFSLLPLLRAGLPQSFRVLPVIAITSRASSGSGRPLATASAMMPMLMMTTTTMP
jgi:diguanylate cyclase (GGDEF)-like protein